MDIDQEEDIYGIKDKKARRDELQQQMGKIIQDKLKANKRRQFKSYQDVLGTKENEEKEDQFIKKEYQFCRGMLMQKKYIGNGSKIAENDQNQYISVLEADRLVASEAELLKSQLYAESIINRREQQLQDIKRQKAQEQALQRSRQLQLQLQKRQQDNKNQDRNSANPDTAGIQTRTHGFRIGPDLGS